MKLKQGDLVMYKNLYNRKLGKLIQKYTKSEYTHCGIVTEVTKDKVWIAEAQAKGYVLISYDYPQLFEDKNLEFYRPKFEIKKNINTFITEHLGTKYGFINYLGILIHSLTGLELFQNGVDSMICSEAVVRAYGIENEFNKSPEFVYPGDLIKSKLFKLLK